MINLQNYKEINLQQQLETLKHVAQLKMKPFQKIELQIVVYINNQVDTTNYKKYIDKCMGLKLEKLHGLNNIALDHLCNAIGISKS
jgi:hypothetical protein